MPTQYIPPLKNPPYRWNLYYPGRSKKAIYPIISPVSRYPIPVSSVLISILPLKIIPKNSALSPLVMTLAFLFDNKKGGGSNIYFNKKIHRAQLYSTSTHHSWSYISASLSTSKLWSTNIDYSLTSCMKALSYIRLVLLILASSSHWIMGCPNGEFQESQVYAWDQLHFRAKHKCKKMKEFY